MEEVRLKYIRDNVFITKIGSDSSQNDEYEHKAKFLDKHFK